MKKLISLLALFLLTSCAGAPVDNVVTPTNSTSGEGTPQTIPSDYEDWTYEEDEEEQNKTVDVDITVQFSDDESGSQSDDYLLQEECECQFL